MTIPPELERTVLRLVREGRGQASWHRLASRLPSFDVPLVPDLMVVLADLKARGLVTQTVVGSGMDRWAITPAGEAALDGKQAPAGVLAPDAVARFIAALRGGAVASAQAVMPYMDDGLKLWAILRQAVAADPSAAPDIAAAGLYLPRTERGPFARELLDDPRPEVREALFRAWTPVELDAPGKPLPTVPDAELDELLRRGLRDPAPAVREAAAALAYAALRGGALVGELTVNLGAVEPGLRTWSLLALGAASDAVSLDLLRQHAGGDDVAEVAAAIRALGQRADGYQAWRQGLNDRRPEVRAAALHALATVVPEVAPDDDARWSAEPDAHGDPELSRAAAAYRARRDDRR
jgi:hypothetical protein